MEVGLAPGDDPRNPVRRRKPVSKPSPTTNQEWGTNPTQRRSNVSTSTTSSRPTTQGVATPGPHYTPLPTAYPQFRQNEATYHGYVEHTGDAGNMTYLENDVQVGQYIKAPDQKVKRKSKKIAAPPAQDYEYTPGYADGYYNTHQQQHNIVNSGQAAYDTHSYEAYDQTTTGGYDHGYGANPDDYAYGYGQGAELGADETYQHHHRYDEAGVLNSNGAFYHTGGGQSTGGAHHDQYVTNCETNYGYTSTYGNSNQPSDYNSYGAELGYGVYDQQPGIGERNGVVAPAPDDQSAERKKKKKKKQQPKDGLSSHDELQHVDGNAHSERTQYNQQPNDPATVYSYGAEQGYGDSQQAWVQESGNGVVPTADQRKIKNQNKKTKPKDQGMIQDGFNGSRSDHEEGSGSGNHDKSNAPPRLDPLAEHIRKTSGPKPSYQDVSMVVFHPGDQSTSLIDPGRFTKETHVTGPPSRNPKPKLIKTQHGNNTTNSTKNMDEDDQRVFRDPLDEYLKQNQGDCSGLPGESMVVFDPKDKSVVDLPGTYNHHPPGPKTRPRSVMSQHPTYHDEQNQKMIIRQQPQAVWGSPPHHHHAVDNVAQGGHQSAAGQVGQPNEKVMKCVHTVGVPCATIATRIAMRQCLYGNCCCTIL